MTTAKNKNESESEKVCKVILKHEPGLCPNGIIETLTIEHSGKVDYESYCVSGKKITVSHFLADSKTANKLLDQIGEIYRKGKMQSSTEIVLDAGTYSIDVDFHEFHVETEGCFSFPEWSEPIIESIRTIFRDCCNGLRPGILYNR